MLRHQKERWYVQGGDVSAHSTFKFDCFGFACKNAVGANVSNHAVLHGSILPGFTVLLTENSESRLMIN